MICHGSENLYPENEKNGFFGLLLFHYIYIFCETVSKVGFTVIFIY